MPGYSSSRRLSSDLTEKDGPGRKPGTRLRGMRYSLLLLAFVISPLAAQTSSRQLREFGGEAEAFNRNDPFANSFRAGYYSGYLNGVLDTLQGRSVCFNECRCELDKLVAAYLLDHPEIAERPVAGWLPSLLEKHYPCK